MDVDHHLESALDLHDRLLRLKDIVFYLLEVREVFYKHLHGPASQLDALKYLPLAFLAVLNQLLDQNDDRLLGRLELLRDALIGHVKILVQLLRLLFFHHLRQVLHVDQYGDLVVEENVKHLDLDSPRVITPLFFQSVAISRAHLEYLGSIRILTTIFLVAVDYVEKAHVEAPRVTVSSVPILGAEGVFLFRGKYFAQQGVVFLGMVRLDGLFLVLLGEKLAAFAI